MIDDFDDSDVAVVPQMDSSLDFDLVNAKYDALPATTSSPAGNPLHKNNSASAPTNQFAHTRPQNEMLQIINEIQEFSPLMSTYMKDKWFLDNKGFDYNVVAVFGSQSTGKSTLLNSLFKTSFEELEKGKRQQTTKGIWCDCAENMNVLILDVEGTDGRERGEDQDFERKSALFSLAIAEVVIVNMWENMVGLYNGANMGLLKTVFEVNLQLFGKNRESKTLLYFVIRDHVSSTPVEVLGNTVQKDLERIWSELSKPGDLANERLSDHFDFKFTSLPHKLLQQDKFDLEVANLRNDFSQPKSTNYVFKKIYKRPVPADGFSRYMESVWEKVVTNRDLDLPTQQELLAQYRCDEISAAALIPFRETTNILRKSLENGSINLKLGSEMKSSRDELLSQFDSQASRYHKNVYAKKRSQLINTIDTELHSLYVVQIKNAIDKSVSEFEIKSKSLLDDLNESTNTSEFSPSINQLSDKTFQSTSLDGFSSIIESQKKVSFNFLKNIIDSTLIQDCNWKFDEDLANLESKLDTIACRLRKSQLENTISQTINTYYEHFSGQISDIISEASPNMWEQVLEAYVKGSKVIEKRLSDYVSLLGAHGLCSSPQKDFDYNHYLSLELKFAKMKSRQLFFDNLVKICKEEFNDNLMILKLRSKFEEKFRYDSNGVPRIWSVNDDIDGQFTIAKAEALKLLPLYSTIDVTKIQKNDILKSTIGSPDFFYSKVDSDNISSISIKKYDISNNLQLLSDHKQRELSKRAIREVDLLFLDAKRSVVSQSSQVPLWMIGLCIVLGWNEAMAVIFNPIYLVLLITVGTFVVAVHYLGMWTPVIQSGRFIAANLTESIHRATVKAAKMVAESDQSESYELGELKSKRTNSNLSVKSSTSGLKQRTGSNKKVKFQTSCESDLSDNE
ncbi:Protein SEY1 [Smittium culicis]|uniref:Protein SEY1 n=2 Tax=Smittium culicis TaxID=133412 RepID=A0A1R1XX43_9FUNG|nr:Protein SEY1 [Smittium culicis]